MKSLIDLGSPAPRSFETVPRLFSYPTISDEPLPFQNNEEAYLFDQVIFGRRTRYGGRPLSMSNIAALLWRTAYCLQSQVLELSSVLKQRPAISAGARHSIDVFVVRKHGDAQFSLHLYNDIAHSLQSLDVPSEAIFPLWAKATKAARGTESTLFWFVSQIDKTSSKYEFPDTLIWRDAGAMMQQFSLVAYALGLTCVPVGPTGNPEIEKMFCSDGVLLGVGGCFVAELEG